LTSREFELLSELSGHRGDVLTRSKLLSTVWGTDFEGAPNIVDVYIGYLRAKIDQLHGSGVQIQTVRGIGYRLTVDPPRSGERP
ncbi:MAG TPA: helix-turn-helix domain-containing protein, partial [Pseudomonadota bacterium]|nr:helix-turn-helix domain-containing protein [Pseudomonadota bacterium]